MPAAYPGQAGELGDLHLGGYLSLAASEDVSQRLVLHDLSLFATWDPGGRWRLFGEFELGDAFVLRDGQLTTDDLEYDLERLYGEYDLQPDLKLRLGKSLTPVGRWNLIHADPLVWTTRRPLATDLPFSTHTTGLSLVGERPWNDGTLDYWFYLDDSGALDPDLEKPVTYSPTDTVLNESFDHAVGGRVHWQSVDGRNGIGLSLVGFRLLGEEENRVLVGADWHQRRNGLELDFEGFYRSGMGQEDWGGFIQAVPRIHGGLYAVGRYEYDNFDSLGGGSSRWLLGLTWRLGRGGVFKLAYQQANGWDVQPEGWVFSYGLLY